MFSMKRVVRSGCDSQPGHATCLGARTVGPVAVGGPLPGALRPSGPDMWGSSLPVVEAEVVHSHGNPRSGQCARADGAAPPSAHITCWVHNASLHRPPLNGAVAVAPIDTTRHVPWPQPPPVVPLPSPMTTVPAPPPKHTHTRTRTNTAAPSAAAGQVLQRCQADGLHRPAGKRVRQQPVLGLRAHL